MAQQSNKRCEGVKTVLVNFSESLFWEIDFDSLDTRLDAQFMKQFSY